MILTHKRIEVVLNCISPLDMVDALRAHAKSLREDAKGFDKDGYPYLAEDSNARAKRLEDDAETIDKMLLP